MDNSQIADAFSLLSKLMDVHGENSFRVKGYSIAAFQIEKLPEQLSNLDPAKISGLKGIGDATGKKIIELLSTGRLAMLEKFIAETLPGILEMMKIKGIGPKKINVIWKEMEIETVGELLYACNENRLTRYKGFGSKTEDNIREAIEFYLSKQGFLLYRDAEPYCNMMEEIVSGNFPANQIHVTGDFRAQAEILEMLEFVTDVPLLALQNFLNSQIGFHFSLQEGHVLIYRMEVGPTLKFHCIETEKIPVTLFSTTGSPEFHLSFQEIFPDLIPEAVATNNEKNIFETLGIAWIPPYLRTDKSIIEKAKRNSIPDVIKPEDIMGIIHCHSTWSDGTHSLEQMAHAAKAIGLEYLVISDHSRSAAYANGLSVDRVLEQHVEIEKLNLSLAPFKIFKSIESDILNDGSLDYPDEILASFDLVIASIHSNLKMPEEKANARLMKAIENPFTTILGHMTGRLLLSRNGYPVNHKLIIDACAANNVVIELNAHPRRLDIDWRWIDYALSKNVLISIDPDAHSTEAFTDTRYGVLVAQKGGLTAEQNLSSKPLAAFEKYLGDLKIRKRGQG